jgi:hypothetical protein
MLGPIGSGMQLRDGYIYWPDDGGNRVIRVDVRLAGCANGVDDDGDGATDFPADAGCSSAEDDGERSLGLACDNGVDDDGDGAVDWPADPGCLNRASTAEAPQCDDGIDNDGDGAIDWNGRFYEFSGYTAPPDPQCGGDPMRVIEHPWYCGLGFEVALLLPVYTTLRRWKRSRS